MTIKSYIKSIVNDNSSKFEDFCTEELSSDVDTISSLLDKKGISFDFVIKFVEYMGITCYLANEETDDTVRIKSTNFPVELERIHGKEQSRYFEFEKFADEYLEFSGKSKDVVSREQVYFIYIKFCEKNALLPMSRKALFRYLRNSIDLADTSLNVEYKDKVSSRWFRGITIKEI